MATERAKPEMAYVFDLHLLCGGYAYFSTITLWSCDNKDNRKIRIPSLTDVAVFEKALSALGRKAYRIESDSHLKRWLLKRGWAIVPESIAQSIMPQWLKKQECLCSGAGTYTDISLAVEGAKKRGAAAGPRRHVMERDCGVCLRCGRGTEDGVKLTTHHIVPYCRGGETTPRNLVLLCEECNQKIGEKYVPELYKLACLPHGYDLGLLAAEMTSESIKWAINISGNLMHTRCVVF